MAVRKEVLCAATLNKAKLASIRNVFGADYEIKEYSVPSGISAQPMSDTETLEGAVNRAQNALLREEGATAAVGLEGGIMEIGQETFICNWGAMATQDKGVFVASGARIPLPDVLAHKLKEGGELGDIIDDYAQRSQVRNDEGAIGILTNGFISRADMFSHINRLLKGQYERSRRTEI